MAESASESGPTLASESPGEPSLLAESASESGPALASESPDEPSPLAESASESGPTLPESLGEPELLDEPLLLDEPPLLEEPLPLDEPLLDPVLPPELEVLPLPDPDPELPLEEDAVASLPAASSPSGGLAPELPQLAATKRARAVAMALVSCLGVGIDRSGMAPLVAHRLALVNPWRKAIGPGLS